jgi:hypothetical protein
MPVIDFLVVNVRIESAFGMGHDEVLKVKYPALNRVTDSGMTDIERNAGVSFSNKFFEKLRSAGPAGGKVLQTQAHAKLLRIAYKLGQSVYSTVPGKAYGRFSSQAEVYGHKPALEPGDNPAGFFEYLHGLTCLEIVLIAEIDTLESAMIPDLEPLQARNIPEKPRFLNLISRKALQFKCPVDTGKTMLHCGSPESVGIRNKIADGDRGQIHSIENSFQMES